MQRIKLIVWFFLVVQGSLLAQDITALRLGILAFRPKEQAYIQWQPLATYLQQTLGMYVELKVYNYPELEIAITHNQVDAILTNPGHYILLKHRNKLSPPIVTQITKKGQYTLTKFGGVIFTRADNFDINSIDDIKDKKIAATDKDSLGGYQMQVFEMLERGLSVPKEEHMVLTGMPHDKVIQTILEHKADVGFVRTNVLEEMILEGKLEISRIKIIHKQHEASFPFITSTRLYPEWPLVLMPHVSESLSRHLSIALLMLTPESNVAKSAGIYGFSSPADYTVVEELLRSLRITPFDTLPKFTLMDFWQKYALWISIGLSIGMLLLIGIGIMLARQNRCIRRNEISLREHQNYLKSILDTIPDGLFEVNLEGKYFSVRSQHHAKIERIFGSIIGKTVGDLLSPEKTNICLTALAEANQKGYSLGYCFDVVLEEEHKWFELSVSKKTEFYADGPHFIVLTRDITSRKLAESRLERIAHYDALTNLPNRVLLDDRLRQAILRAKRQDKKVAVLYLDLDGFKEINDVYGHSIGDELLISVSRRMENVLRQEDALSRFGGDEFVIILADLECEEDSITILQRLLEVTAEPVELHAIMIHITVSIGITFYPQDDVDADHLIRHADQAMYLAKQSGRNTYRFFDVAYDTAQKSEKIELENIAFAIQNHQFVLHYQPKVNIQTGELVGVEALIRWQHPKRGLLYPHAFLPLIEHRMLSVNLGEWVIEEALKQLVACQHQGIVFPISVNISATQLQQENFFDRISELLQKYSHVNPKLLELEILETSALKDRFHVCNIIAQCKEKFNIHFALDDFGTGYSSLTYLKELPVDCLKIDQSFVRDILHDIDDLAIVQGVLGLAKAFHREVIAEGVESQAHGELLLHQGCYIAQGYGIAKPMSAEALFAWIQTRDTQSIWLE